MKVKKRLSGNRLFYGRFRKYLLFITVLLMGMAFLTLLITGMAKYPPLQWLLNIDPYWRGMALTTAIHDISGLVMAGIIFFHIVLHFRWLIHTAAGLLRKLPALPLPGKHYLKASSYIPLLVLISVSALLFLAGLSMGEEPAPDDGGAVIDAGGWQLNQDENGYDRGSVTIPPIDMPGVSGNQANLNTPASKIGLPSGPEPATDAAFEPVPAATYGLLSEATPSLSSSLSPPPSPASSQSPPSPPPSSSSGLSVPVITADTRPSEQGRININNSNYSFNPAEIATARPDIFRPGYFSVFDILVHLSKKGVIELAYHYSDEMETHIIDSVNGAPGNWWYRVAPDGGGFEENSLRMDLYPYKDKSGITVTNSYNNSQITMRYDLFKQETTRRKADGGKTVLPYVIIRFPDTNSNQNLIFTNVQVKAHNLRYDMFQDGVITSIDALLTLRDMGLLSVSYEWYASLGAASVINAYYVTSINGVEQSGRCGFTYETGPRLAPKPPGNLIHVFSDMRVIVPTPEMVLFQWRCL